MICVAQIGGGAGKNEMNYGVKIVQALFVFQLVEFVNVKTACLYRSIFIRSIR